MTYGVNAPLGLVANSTYGSAPWTGSIFPYYIASGTASNIFKGDLVTMVNGLVTPYAAGGGAANPPVGVFNGCTYTNTNGIVVFSNYWPTGTVTFAAQNAFCQVITDPNTIFSIQTAAAGQPALSVVNKNVDIIVGAGNTNTGQSTSTANTTYNTTSTFPLHIIGFDPIPGNVPGLLYANLLVKLNNTSTNAGATGV